MNSETIKPSTDNRQRAILERVGARGFQSIDALAAQYGVTTQTIRRDVNALCERGLCRRRHGGIDVLPTAQNIAYDERLSLENEAERSHLRVMTNNINVALALRGNPACELTIAGGRLRNPDFDVIAGEAHGFFQRFAVDIGIYGVGGVADDGSLLDFNDDEVAMRRELAAHCQQRFLVLDHSKFGRGATVRGGHITEASQVFTDQAVPAPIDAMLKRAGVALIVASSPTAL